ncbi:protein farnesyltransferase [Salvia divinorum]|uniref:Protein farnesyltransferase subunit beta n=1 Tax=Salvia divinorum TaxID=28513 RepID=A0ABD1FZ82_SALDI
MTRENLMKGTTSQEDQWTVQNQCFRIYEIVYRLPPQAQSINFEVLRENHIEYLTESLKQLGRNFYVLDANRPWLCYWIIQSIALLGDCVDDKLENGLIDFLSRCQDQDGGYGGGPGQMPHLATTYAAVNALITVGGQNSLSSINREKLYNFLLRMKDASGGFRMHDGGEVDVRACYTAISVASVLNILDDRLIQNVGDYIVSCQTYEGGIAGEPCSEAHGGYTFCGLAAMVLINEADRLNLPELLNWVMFRQGIEGGFQGRTNKLVDGCYSFWQGAVAAIIQRLHVTVKKQLGLPDTFELDCSTESGNESSDDDGEEVSEGSSSPVDISEPTKGESLSTSAAMGLNNGYDFIKRPTGMKPLFNSMALQQYILLCTQEEAGFRDKPGKRRDHYHTCYVLSGLSVCQHCNKRDADSPPLSRDVMGPYSNLVEPVHPLHNIVLDKYYEAHMFFARA